MTGVLLTVVVITLFPKALCVLHDNAPSNHPTILQSIPQTVPQTDPQTVPQTPSVDQHNLLVALHKWTLQQWMVYLRDRKLQRGSKAYTTPDTMHCTMYTIHQ